VEPTPTERFLARKRQGDVGHASERIDAEDQEFQRVHQRRLCLAATTVLAHGEVPHARAVVGGLDVLVHR
jgi:hypothetical protein